MVTIPTERNPLYRKDLLNWLVKPAVCMNASPNTPYKSNVSISIAKGPQHQNTGKNLSNLARGCPATVHSRCYKSLVLPVLEYASVVWEPHQKNLKSDTEMVQRRAARRIFYNFTFSHSTNVSALVTRLELQQLETRARVAEVSIICG